MTDLTIVFLNYQCRDDILAAVASVQNDICGCAYAIKLIVVDNSNNQDRLKEDLAQKFPAVEYINAERNVGFGRGNVIGFQAAPARYYAALNRDVIIPESTRAIERLIRFMDEHPKVGAVGPKLLNLDGTVQYACYRFDLPSLLIKPLKQINWDEKYRWVKKRADRLLMRDFDHNETRPVDWVLGAALVARQEAINDVGWFDDRYFMYMEDCDWCRTMWERGWPVYYVHDIAIKHRYQRDSAKVPGVFRALFKNKLARIHLVSWLKYMWKWRGTFKYYT